MTVRALLALALLTALTLDSEAGPFRRRSQPSSPAPSYQPTYQPPYQPPYQPASVESVTSTSHYTPIAATDSVSGDGLDEVNALRAARGLRPFARDAALTEGARACAAARAARFQFGHTSNDFAFLPPGAAASAAGCAAYPASYGWMSCCVYDGGTTAGAAWVAGADGKRYMQLFVR
ncbi:hypothetical protein [Urbifossiella limnaea]|uniref:SCP domain-containing protein n=1 Tax=Urbifossiella limnaea TaxID=2528023 RepID=A0A517Y0G9_9BACT|nr:hypothetical protein [Urbifossiella limnaea]QDU23254.1 hypothetical protein ETAA1_52460 [Urbifossiella limnaea]